MSVAVPSDSSCKPWTGIISRTGALSQPLVAKPPPDELPHCIRKWGQLSGKALDTVLVALAPESLGPVQLAQLADSKSKLHLLCWGLQVNPKDSLPDRFLTSLVQKTMSRHANLGSPLSKPADQIHGSESPRNRGSNH
jgi:hypothetical protein